MIPRRTHGTNAVRANQAWQEGMALVVRVYAVTRGFPNHEMWGLTRQLRRGAISVPSNIAEGTERDTIADRRRFLTMARSTLAEIETQLEAAVLLAYMEESALLETLVMTDRLSRMLTRMHRNIRARPSHSTDDDH